MGLKETFAFAHKLITEEERVFSQRRDGVSPRSMLYVLGVWRNALGMRRWVCLFTNLSQRKRGFFHRGGKDFRSVVSFTFKENGGMPLA